jgi:hypothetical protein
VDGYKEHKAIWRIYTKVIELMSSVDDLSVVVSDLSVSVGSLDSAVRAFLASNPGGVPVEDPRLAPLVAEIRADKDKIDSLLASVPPVV